MKGSFGALKKTLKKTPNADLKKNLKKNHIGSFPILLVQNDTDWKRERELLK